MSISRYHPVIATLPAFAVLFVALVLAPEASAAPGLATARVHGIASKTADKVRRDLKTEGATRASVAGCWRNSPLRVSCFLKVRGYDPELESRWTCMIRMVVELRPQRRGRGRLAYRYGTPVCG